MRKTKIVLINFFFTVMMIIILPKSVIAAVNTDNWGNFYANGTEIIIATPDTNIGDRTALSEFDVSNFSDSNTAFPNGAVIYWGTVDNGGYVYASSAVNVYGGRQSSTFNGNTSITMTGGKLSNIFGGGYTGSVTGNTYVEVRGGSVSSIHGGCNQSATVSGTAHVIISDNGTQNYGYGGIYGGGGNNTTTANTLVEVSSKVLGNVFGGGYGSAQILRNTKVIIKNGAYVQFNVYGGGSTASTVSGNSKIEISGGQIMSSVYGGSELGPSYVSGTRTISLSGNPEIGKVYTSINRNYIHGIHLDSFTNNRILISGPLTGAEGAIKLMPGPQELTTVVATSQTEAYLDASYFRMYTGNHTDTVNENPVKANFALKKISNGSGAELQIAMVYGEAMQGNIGFFANGMALIITGTDDETLIYQDLDRDGNLDSTENVSENIVYRGNFLGLVFGGGEGKNTNYDTMITMLSGKVNAIYGGGYNGTTNGNTNVFIKGGKVSYSVNGGGATSLIQGNTNITISGGEVNDIFGASYNTCTVTGDRTITISGGTVNQLVNIMQGTNSDSKGRVLISGNPIINKPEAEILLTHVYENKVTISGPLTGGPNTIRLKLNLSNITPSIGTVLATAIDPIYANDSVFDLPIPLHGILMANTRTGIVYVGGTPYSITLNGNGSSIYGSVTASYGMTLPIFTPITRTGYTLTGYFTETNGGTKVINAQGILETNVSGYSDEAGKWIRESMVTLYAQWRLTDYTITYYTNSDTVIPADHYNINNGNIMLPTTITKTGYTFEGWYEDEACTILAGKGGESYVPTADINLYAKWKQNPTTTNSDATNPDNNKIKPNVTNPHTSDASHILLWIILMIISTVGITTVIIIQNKRKIY